MSHYPIHHYPKEMYQTGSGIFQSIGNFFKKSKIASKLGSIISPLVGLISPPAGAALGAATAVAKQAGYGHGGRRPKPLTKTQVDCLTHGTGIKLLKSGAVSLAGVKNRYRTPPKNITPGQFRALVYDGARWGKGRSITFGSGPVLAGRGPVLAGRGATLPGRGATLPGRGVYIAGQTGRGTRKGMVRKTARRAYKKKAKY